MNQPPPPFNDNITQEGDIDNIDGPHLLARVRKLERRRSSKSLPPPDSIAGQEQSHDRQRVLLSNPETLPVRELTHIARQRVVVVAPHPDDETLGCGGAIALLCAKGYDVKVAIVSDGTMSHPNSRSYPAPALRSLRESETIAALAILGIEDRSLITFLGLKDGSVPTITSPTFQAAKVLCQEYLKQTLPDTIFLPWRADPHPDHRATWQLIQAAILSLGISPQIIEYPIWDWDIQQQKKLPDLDRIFGWRLDIDKVSAQKQQAIAAYKSQLGQAIEDDPDGFCLTPEMLTNFTRSWEVYFEEI